MLRQHPAEIAALRAIFDPATHAHRPDCCGPNIGTDCIGCAMAEREEYAAEIERLRSYVGNNMLMSDFRNVDGMRAEIARLTAERDSAEKCCSMLSRINNGIILAMQAAWIAHQYGKEPADSVMEWIANSLDGPGLLPDPGDDGFTTDAQAWFDAQIAERPDDGIVHAAKICPNCDTDLPDGCGGLFENDHDCMWRKT